MRIASDRRCRQATPDPVAERMVREASVALREAEIKMARGLARVHRKRTFLLSGCGSAVEYGARYGLSSRRALDLLRAGMALEAERGDDGERRLREGRITTDDVAQVGKLYAAEERAAREAARQAKPGDVLDLAPVVQPGEDWFLRAGEISPTRLRREVNERIEGHRAGEPVRTLSIAAPESTIDAFRRSQILASRKARRFLSEGETLGAVCDDYLTRHDPLRTVRRARRVGPTSQRPRDRYVPAAVVAAVLRRSEDRCEFPGCTNRVFLDFAHIVGHGRRGSREVWNILRLCTEHHAQFDAGRIRVLEWRRGTDGVERPVFVDAVTGEVHAPRRRDPPEDPAQDATAGDAPTGDAPGDTTTPAAGDAAVREPAAGDGRGAGPGRADSGTAGESDSPPNAVRETPPPYARPSSLPRAPPALTVP